VKRKIIVIAFTFVTLFLLSCNSNNKKDELRKNEVIKVDAPFEMPDIKVPSFPNKIFDISKYGAVKGDSINNSEAINNVKTDMWKKEMLLTVLV